MAGGRLQSSYTIGLGRLHAFTSIGLLALQLESHVEASSIKVHDWTASEWEENSCLQEVWAPLPPGTQPMPLVAAAAAGGRPSGGLMVHSRKTASMMHGSAQILGAACDGAEPTQPSPWPCVFKTNLAGSVSSHGAPNIASSSCVPSGWAGLGKLCASIYSAPLECWKPYVLAQS